MVDMHADELVVSAETGRALVDEQFPKWRGLRLHRVSAAGTGHEIFRLVIGWRLGFTSRPMMSELTTNTS